MKKYRVTIVVEVLAESEQTAWEYGHALAGKDPQSIRPGVADDASSDGSKVEVEDND